ncbi:hypothetical protein D0Z08_19475 [Nocardioides immobilis]|uniref:Uncharacterized protein n=1 Tax=Nocardioides immobilis TaxID=2049295 RepID=A0A417XYG1_9ACTN|nr:hypothetical protein [Nocardioides immobilis]RHW25410.1 hypothetical protein D0Z08_19475 [Nocardioides immobilis]
MARFRYGDFVRHRDDPRVGMVTDVSGTGVVEVEFTVLFNVAEFDQDDLVLVARTARDLVAAVSRGAAACCSPRRVQVDCIVNPSCSLTTACVDRRRSGL